MSAFVTAPGVSATSSRVFLTGTSLRQSKPAPRDEDQNAPVEISALQLPKIPKLPSPPKLPSLPKLGGPKESTPDRPSPRSLSIGGRSVDPSKRPVEASGDSVFARGIPKFYNPATSRAEFIATAKGHNATAFDVRVGRETNTTNRRINEQGTFRNMDPYTDELVWARPGWSSDEARVGVRVALRNILGNAYVFDSELAELAYNISCVTETANMKEFVRAIGLSSAYRKRFFESTSNTRFVECNFKHFLGRAPRSQAEVSEHIQIINEQGYNAEINSYIDSDEYDILWGESRIPAVNFRGGHPYNNDMNKLGTLNGGFSTSDRLTTRSVLVSGDRYGFSSYGILKGLPEAWRGENEARNRAGAVMNFPADSFWNPQPAGLRDAELDWVGRMGTWTKFWYKDSAIYQDMMKPNLSVTPEEKEMADATLKYGSTMAKSYVGTR